MANISIPLKINEDGTVTTLSDNIEISFSNCDVVLGKSNNELNYEKSSNDLKNLIAKLIIPDIPIIKILKSEINSKKTIPRNQHLTFKNHKKTYTDLKKTLRTTTKSR